MAVPKSASDLVLAAYRDAMSQRQAQVEIAARSALSCSTVPNIGGPGLVPGMPGGAGAGMPVASGMAHLAITTHIAIDRDNLSDIWRCRIWANQGNQQIVLYDGPFPITDQTLIDHFAYLARQALTSDPTKG